MYIKRIVSLALLLTEALFYIGIRVPFLMSDETRIERKKLCPTINLSIITEFQYLDNLMFLVFKFSILFLAETMLKIGFTILLGKSLKCQCHEIFKLFFDLKESTLAPYEQAKTVFFFAKIFDRKVRKIRFRAVLDNVGFPQI